MGMAGTFRATRVSCPEALVHVNGLRLQHNTGGLRGRAGGEARNAIQHAVRKHRSRRTMSRDGIPREPELESIAK